MMTFGHSPSFPNDTSYHFEHTLSFHTPYHSVLTLHHSSSTNTAAKRRASNDNLAELAQRDSENSLLAALAESQTSDVGMDMNNNMGNNNSMGMGGGGWGAPSGGSSFGGGAPFGGELSPTAPSMPVPSSPSFQAQSRRPKPSSFENKPTTRIMNNADDDEEEDDERNGSDIEDVGDEDDSGDEKQKPQKSSVKSSSASNQKKKGTSKTNTDWELDSNDEKAPSFAPGSTRDEDWKERDLETAKGYGMENSYGVVTDPLHPNEQQDRKHEPPDPKTATPGKSAIGSTKGNDKTHMLTFDPPDYQLKLKSLSNTLSTTYLTNPFSHSFLVIPLQSSSQKKCITKFW